MKTEIIYEDQDILICHKPAGLATQSASVSQPDVVSELKRYLGGGYLGIVHRLDQPVEGLLVFARSKKAAAVLSRQLAEGVLQKRYCALVYGHPPQEEGLLVDYLRKEGSLSRVVSEGDQEAKKAVLQYRVRRAYECAAAGRVSAGSGHGDVIQGSGVQRNMVHGGETHSGAIAACHSSLDIQIDTGRFHQIRCQLSHAGMPILGDRKYGTEESLEESKRLGIRQTALCACEIRLRHPMTGQEIYHEIVPDWMT